MLGTGTGTWPNNSASVSITCLSSSNTNSVLQDGEWRHSGEGLRCGLAGDSDSLDSSGDIGKQAKEKDWCDAASSCPDSSEGKRGPRGICIRYV